MVKSESGEIEVNGTKADVRADVATLLYCLREKIGDDFVDECVELSKGNVEEIIGEAIDDLLKEVRLITIAKMLGQMPEEELDELRKKLGD